MVHLWGLVPVLGRLGTRPRDTERCREEGGGRFTPRRNGRDEPNTPPAPDLVAPAYKEAPVVTGDSLRESFEVAKAVNWPGDPGSPRLASARLGETIWKSFAAAAIEHAVKILDGVAPRDSSATPISWRKTRYTRDGSRRPLFMQNASRRSNRRGSARTRIGMSPLPLDREGETGTQLVFT